MINSTTLHRIPVVSALDAHDDFESFSKRIGESLENSGFVLISDHSLPSHTLDECLSLFKTFFSRSDSEKAQYHQPGLAGARGYTPFGIETAQGESVPDLKEFWHVGRELPIGHRFESMMPMNVWVNDLPEFKQTLLATYQAFEQLGALLLRGIAHYLHLPADWFDAAVCDGNSILRILHYPPIVSPTQALRAAAHGDINVITLLLGAEEAGLEVFHPSYGWMPIEARPGTLVCNVGDMLARLTNGKLPSALHRVTNPPPSQPDRSRYSLPFFMHFNPDFLVKTLPYCIDATHPDAYPTPMTANDLLQERLAAIRLK